MAAGVPQGRWPEFRGGGLLRSRGGWAAVAALRRGREAYLGDDRILGGTTFIAQLRQAVETAEASRPNQNFLDALVARVCAQVGIAPADLAAGGRTTQATQARAGIAYLWDTVLGHPGRPLAPILGVRSQNVYRADAQGGADAAVWDRLLATC